MKHFSHYQYTISKFIRKCYVEQEYDAQNQSFEIFSNSKTKPCTYALYKWLLLTNMMYCVQDKFCIEGLLNNPAVLVP